MSRGTRTFNIYRYDPDKDAAPYMQTFKLELTDKHRMLLDALLALKVQDESSHSTFHAQNTTSMARSTL